MYDLALCNMRDNPLRFVVCLDKAKTGLQVLVSPSCSLFFVLKFRLVIPIKVLLSMQVTCNHRGYAKLHANATKYTNIGMITRNLYIKSEFYILAGVQSQTSNTNSRC